MELKEGMYVRSKINGMIGKITDEDLGKLLEILKGDNNE